MTVLLVIHIIIVVCLVGSILLQKSSNDGFSGGGVGNVNSMFSSRGKANFLSRATAILATAFIANSLLLAYLSSHTTRDGSIVEEVEVKKEEVKKDFSKPVVPLAE